MTRGKIVSISQEEVNLFPTFKLNTIEQFSMLWLELSKYVHWGFHQVWYQGGVKGTVSGVIEDVKFKISEGSNQNWCFPGSAQLAVSV